MAVLPLDDLLRRAAPCCGTEVALDSGQLWPWETGYARFVPVTSVTQRI